MVDINREVVEVVEMVKNHIEINVGDPVKLVDVFNALFFVHLTLGLPVQVLVDIFY